MTYLITIGIAVLAYFGWNWYKATKDPDVQAASDLRMNVFNYRHYRKLYDDYSKFMQQHGPSSKESDDYFVKTIWPQIKNPNEWRRYQQYRQEQYDAEYRERINNWLGGNKH